jgi:hypothetical protein
VSGFFVRESESSLSSEQQTKTTASLRSRQRLLLNLPPNPDLEPERSERRKVLPPRLQKPRAFAVGGLKA